LSAPRPASPSSAASSEAGHYGLSWAALVNRWVIIGFVLLALSLGWFFDLFDAIASMPYYWVVAGAAAVLWWPYLMNVHRANMARLIVYEAPNRLTLYRIGREVPGFNIEGRPVSMISRTGVERLFVTEFDEQTGAARGAAVDGMTALDYMRDISVFSRLSDAHCGLLDEERLTRELVAVMTQDAVRHYSERWVNIGIASQDPAPIEAELAELLMLRREEAERVDVDELGDLEGGD